MRWGRSGAFPVGRQVLEISLADGRDSGFGPGRRSGVILPYPLLRSARLGPSRHSDPFSRKSTGNHCNGHSFLRPKPKRRPWTPGKAIGRKDPCGTSNPQEPKSTTPTHSNAHKNTALRSPPTPRGQGSAEDAAGMCRRHSMGASQGSVWLNSQKIPRPTPCRGSGPAPSPWAPPTPMPRRRCPLAREPATPRLPKPLRTSRRPAPPYRAKGREAPKGAARMCRR